MIRPLSGMIVLGWLLAALPAGAAAVEKHSGVVTSVEGAQITIEEMGPWRGPDTKPMHRTFQLTPATKVERVARAPEGSDGWLWSYVSRPLDRADLRTGDYVTVTVDPAAERNVVLEVEAVRPGPNALN
jgi:hypothetical protein